MPEVQKQRIRGMVARWRPECRVSFDPACSPAKLRFRIDDDGGNPIALSDWCHPTVVAAWSDQDLRERILSYLTRGVTKRHNTETIHSRF